MNNPKNEPGAVELLIVAGLALLWAVATIARLLLVPLLAMALMLAGWRPGPRAAAPQAPPTAPTATAAPLPQPPAVALACAPEPAGMEPPPLERLTVAVPCIADLADDLLLLPATQLRAMAGTRRRLPKRELTALICALPI